LQKIASIFFISLLIFFHYGKALTYLHCVFTNIINTGNVYCDCEKQMKDSADSNQSNSAKKADLKEKSTDNWFTYSNQDLYQLSHAKIILTIAKHNSSQFPAGFYNSVFQPPKA